eukprot:CAMPEP_0168733642 /NCGR_PEP_ID=MMETSP0724-20121128/8398_1 /TAXON_ID=265536 /ORGANISM="Amphiprora sp., Strain CCMP467" /LENGTH=231 /DNA_ID=CAMNT_0008780711 /DNA_START=37 /DNA_END=732 /DNA_ORIENTATION=+
MTASPSPPQTNQNNARKSSLRNRAATSPLANTDHEQQQRPYSSSNDVHRRSPLINDNEPSQQEQAQQQNSTMTTTAHNLSQSELQDLQCAFTLLDTQKQGEISVDTLRNALLSRPTALARLDAWRMRQQEMMQSSPRQEEPRTICLNFEDFVHVLTDDDDSSRSELEKVFDLMDGDGKGYITVTDLHRIAQGLGESMTLEELDEMIVRADAEQGRVTLECFERIMNQPMFE